MLFPQFSRRTIRAFRVASEYRKSRNPELARNKLSYLREKSRASAVYCEPKRSRAKIRPDKKREKERTGDGGSYILRSFVRPFIRSYRFFLFAATPYCQVAYTRRALERLLLAGTCERRATYPHTCRCRRVTSVATSHAFSASVRVAILLREEGKTMSPYVLAAVAQTLRARRRVILEICLAPGNTSRVVIDADIIGFKNASRETTPREFYAAINSSRTGISLPYLSLNCTRCMYIILTRQFNFLLLVGGFEIIKNRISGFLALIRRLVDFSQLNFSDGLASCSCSYIPYNVLHSGFFFHLEKAPSEKYF